MVTPTGIWTAFFTGPEGRIFLAGLGLTLLGLAGLGLSWFWWPEDFELLVGLTATASLFGRAAGLSFGYAVGLDHVVVVPVTMAVETAFVFLFYPLFVLGWNELLGFRPLQRFVERTNRTAVAHEEGLRHYGIAGLLVFVWFPFWLTGPVIGSAIGYLLGLRAWVNMSVVLSGTYLAIVCWAVLLRELQDRAAAYGALAPLILVVVLILAGVIVQALAEARHAHEARRERRSRQQ